MISAALLVLLCAYLVAVGLAGIATRLHPAGSWLGVAVSAGAVLAMPVLAWRKRSANAVIGSSALRADVAETITCAYMAAATLAGAGLNLLFGLWWAEYVAALALLASSSRREKRSRRRAAAKKTRAYTSGPRREATSKSYQRLKF